MFHAYFCAPDSVYYEDPWSAAETGPGYAATSRDLPTGWVRVAAGPWIQLAPSGYEFPDQGWKVHVSCVLPQAERVIDSVWAFCLGRGVPFKFLHGPMTALLANQKYANRQTSGKTVTIYPADDEELHDVLAGLGAELNGTAGPYILSDLRWKDGPLYLRYGGFAERYCWSPDGERITAIAAPSGDLVPDERGTVFAVPAWAPVPSFVKEAMIARRDHGRTDSLDFPFTVTEALHFSNGGGIYLATDQRTGSTVILREARPHAGLDRAGLDAVSRLLSEREVLRQCADLEFVPDLYEHRVAWEHHFLIQERIEGRNLSTEIIRRFTAINSNPSRSAVGDYAAWALDALEQLESMVRCLHSRGVVFGDLHPGNIMVRPDGRLALVDFELAGPIGSRRPPTLGAPGFISPAATTGSAIDWYAYGTLRIHLFLPLTSLIDLDSTRVSSLLAAIATRFPVPADYAGRTVEILRTATGGSLPAGLLESGDSATWTWPRDLAGAAQRSELLRSLAASIGGMATPDRRDRLFPGDPEQFATRGFDLAYGAAGVLHTLDVLDEPAAGGAVEWLVRRARTAEQVRPGLYDGLVGAAWFLSCRGREEDAVDLVRRAVPLLRDLRAVGLGAGLGGVALGLLRIGHQVRDASLLAHGQAMAEHLLRFCLAPAVDRALIEPRHAGLMNGWSGLAVLFLAVFETTAESRWLDAAETALRRDLSKAEYVDDQLMIADKLGRTMMYLADGSAGYGLVARQFLAHRAIPEIAGSLEAVDAVCEQEFLAAPGLFEGRAGLIYYLAARRADHASGWDPIHAHLDRLADHVLSYEGRPAVPGKMLFRVSADLATGSAGLALALHAAFTGSGRLPFLEFCGRPPQTADIHERST